MNLLRRARGENKNITGEAAPHHFILSEDDHNRTDANYKMNPPLRSKSDVAAVLGALKDGTIGVIASDHAPHHESEKNTSYDSAANGIVGLETTVPLCITCLVNAGHLSPSELIEKLTVNPADILGIKKGTLSEGADADITIIDPHERYKINRNDFFSKGRNTPFDGYDVNGRVRYTILYGKIVYRCDPALKKGLINDNR